MRSKKMKKIATGGLVGTLLFVSSGSVKAQNSPAPTNIAQTEKMQETDTTQQTDLDFGIGISANDDVRGESRQVLLEQGFSPSQIKSLHRRGFADN